MVFNEADLSPPTSDYNSVKHMAMTIADTTLKSSFVRGNIKGEQVKILVDTGSHYAFLTPELAKKLDLKVEAIPSEELETAGGKKLCVNQWVPRLPITLHTLKDRVTKSNALRVMPMHQHDVLLGQDFMYNTLNIQHDLTITTRKGEMWQQWFTPDVETVTPISWTCFKKVIRS